MEGNSNLEIKSSVSNVSTRRTTPKITRWSPTAEQTRTLEHYYGQGLRRPTVEHIQEITAKLKCFGKAEGKNVFYWFQNRKARQVKRLRQDTVAAYMKRMVRRCHNVNGNSGCTDRPHQVPRNDMETHPQNSKVCPPSGIEMNRKTETVAVNAKSCITEHAHQQNTTTEHNLIDMSATRETLILFPLHPTVGMMEQELNNSPTSATVDHPRSASEERVESDGQCAQLNFFQLFTGQSYQMRD